MTFIEFLLQKRINSATFQAEKPEMWQHFAQLFDQMGEKSFDGQKKFYFNPLRADFPLFLGEIEQIEAEKKAATIAKKIPTKPVIPVKAIEETTLEEPVKKMPPKMKPIIKKEAVLEENEMPISPEMESEPIKKVPPKMKPIMKKETVLEEKEMPVLPEIESEPIKKVPTKMKPIMKKEAVLEEKEMPIFPEIESEPVKKVPPKMKPIMKKEIPPTEE